MSGLLVTSCAKRGLIKPRLLHQLPPAPRMATKYWLLKAEPDSRIVKGKDVKVNYLASNSKRALTEE